MLIELKRRKTRPPDLGELLVAVMQTKLMGELFTEEIFAEDASAERFESLFKLRSFLFRCFY